MDDLVHNEELLMRYLDGELSPEEKADVEQRLQNDEGFKNQLLNLQVAVQAIRHIGTIQQVEDIHRNMMQELKNGKSSGKVVQMKKAIRYTMAIAASILVLFIGVRLYLNAQISPDNIYKETFVDFNVANTRSADNNLTKIETLYQQGSYETITSSAHTLNLTSKDSLLTGLSYLHTGNLPSAINWFHTMATTSNNYQQDAEFYLSLSYLKNKNYDQALSYMESIHNNPSHLYYQQLSADVIEKVKKLKEK